MLYSNKNKEELENLGELASIKNRIKELHLQEKLGKQNFHESTKESFVPSTDTFKIAPKI